MLVYPAIDITGGRVARSDGLDPVAAAEQFLAAGASWLHVVDLDRAFAGGRDNDGLVRRIAALPGANVQVGGLLTGLEQVEHTLALGVARAVVATVAAAAPGVLERIARAVPGVRLAVGIDVREGRVVARDVPEPLPVEATALARRAAAAGIGVVVYRDLGRDGALTGPDLAGASRLVGLAGSVLLAGGIAGIGDLEAAREAGLAGAIVGRALYQQRLTIQEALACCS